MGRFFILNLVLSVTLVTAAVRLHNDWFLFEAAHQTGSIQPQPETVAKAVPPPSPAPGAPVDWTEIPSRNPFSFDRTDVAILEPTAPPKPPGPKPVLFGTMSLGSERMAMVSQGQPGNRNYKPMKVGEVIDGWTIAEIKDKEITITADTLRDSVIMNDPSAQVPRDAARTMAAAAPPGSSAAPAAPIFSMPTPTPQTPGTGPRPTRRVQQMTPFGIREFEEPIP